MQHLVEAALAIQFKSSLVYNSFGVISYREKSPTSAIISAIFLVVPLALKYTTNVLFMTITSYQMIVDAETGEIQVIKAGAHEDALAYELSDMEKAITGDVSCMHLDYTKDVMDLMTEFRRSWNFTYPEEEK